MAVEIYYSVQVCTMQHGFTKICAVFSVCFRQLQLERFVSILIIELRIQIKSIVEKKVFRWDWK